MKQQWKEMKNCQSQHCIAQQDSLGTNQFLKLGHKVP